MTLQVTARLSEQRFRWPVYTSGDVTEAGSQPCELTANCESELQAGIDH
jgi:hypothetical protein